MVLGLFFRHPGALNIFDSLQLKAWFVRTLDLHKGTVDQPISHILCSRKARGARKGTRDRGIGNPRRTQGLDNGNIYQQTAP